MKKILLVIDAVNPCKNAFDFACYIARLKDAALTGVFMENTLAEQHAVLLEANGPSVYGVAPGTHRLIEANIEEFKTACQQKDINCIIHRDRNMPVKEIVEESRFADLVIVSATTSFDANDNRAISQFVRKVLLNAECPVIVAPETFHGIDEVVFTYDGSKSSMFAIRQFTYLFPEFKYKKVTVLEIKHNEDSCITNKYKVKEWFKMHYPNFLFKIEYGVPKDELFSYFMHKKQTLVVAGAYGRSAASIFFEDSAADILLRTTTLPVFITHH